MSRYGSRHTAPRATVEDLDAATGGEARAGGGGEQVLDRDGRNEDWLEAHAALMADDHAVALRRFADVGGAALAAGDFRQAAIAFRTAAGQAQVLGLPDQVEDLIRRAAGAYEQVASRETVPTVVAYDAHIEAARCWLYTRDLNAAEAAIAAARAVDVARTAAE